MKTGVDIVEIKRLEKYVDDDKFLKKYFTISEIEYINNKRGESKLQALAGLYASKEAVLKTFGIGIGRGLELKEICINHDEFGQPFVEVDAKIQHYLNINGCSEIAVSISHEKEYAIAFCVIN